jgi:hypothetical protein
VIKQVGGGDEVWYNPGDGRFYVTGPDTATPPLQSLGVIDAEHSKWLQNVPDMRGRNPSAFPEKDRIFTAVTVTGAMVTSPGTDNSICATTLASQAAGALWSSPMGASAMMRNADCRSRGITSEWGQ